MDGLQVRLWRECLYGDVKKFFSELSDTERSFLCESAANRRTAPAFYRILHDKLPAEYKQTFQQLYQLNSARTAAQKSALDELFGKLEQENIRFAPLKGAELAYEIYPEAAMRYFSDWDILFHPEDCQRALEFLEKDNWQAPYLDEFRNPDHHHFELHRKGKLCLEPHWRLPHMKNFDEHQLWEYIFPISPGASRHRLSAEFSLLQLTRHLASHTDNMLDISLPVFLMDCGYLLKKRRIDWQKMREICSTHQIPYPGNMLGGWQDFFPQELLTDFAADAESAKLYRNVFDAAMSDVVRNKYQTAMSRSDTLSKKWIRMHLNALRPKVLRSKYHLAPRGQYFTLFGKYISELTIKSLMFVRYFFSKEKNVSEKSVFFAQAESNFDGK